MKRNIIYRFIIMIIILFLASNPDVTGQPPDPPGGHGLNGNQGPGGAAPIDGGIGILLLSGLGYSLMRVMRENKVKKL